MHKIISNHIELVTIPTSQLVFLKITLLLDNKEYPFLVLIHIRAMVFDKGQI